MCVAYLIDEQDIRLPVFPTESENNTESSFYVSSRYKNEGNKSFDDAFIYMSAHHSSSSRRARSVSPVDKPRPYDKTSSSAKASTPSSTRTSNYDDDLDYTYFQPGSQGFVFVQPMYAYNPMDYDTPSTYSKPASSIVGTASTFTSMSNGVSDYLGASVRYSPTTPISTATLAPPPPIARAPALGSISEGISVATSGTFLGDDGLHLPSTAKTSPLSSRRSSISSDSSFSVRAADIAQVLFSPNESTAERASLTPSRSASDMTYGDRVYLAERSQMGKNAYIPRAVAAELSDSDLAAVSSVPRTHSAPSMRIVAYEDRSAPPQISTVQASTIGTTSIDMASKVRAESSLSQAQRVLDESYKNRSSKQDSSSARSYPHISIQPKARVIPAPPALNEFDMAFDSPTDSYNKYSRSSYSSTTTVTPSYSYDDDDDVYDLRAISPLVSTSSSRSYVSSSSSKSSSGLSYGQQAISRTYLAAHAGNAYRRASVPAPVKSLRHAHLAGSAADFLGDFWHALIPLCMVFFCMLDQLTMLTSMGDIDSSLSYETTYDRLIAGPYPATVIVSYFCVPWIHLAM